MTTTSCSQNDLESKYAHLLQPIRDLAKNWDIDLTSQLENYLSEIEKVTISFDGGTTTMNFAEAALLIQGSACIYGRKVEYLYSLVCQVNDLVSSNKKQQNQGQKESTSDVGESNVNDEQEFLSLDDIQEHRNITLKNDTDQAANRVDIVPPTPTVLMRLEDFQRSSTPLVGRNGEAIGNRNDFRMNIANIHTPTGCILLDLAFASFIGQMTPIPAALSHVVTGENGVTATSLAVDVAEEHEIDEGCGSDISHTSDGLLPCNGNDHVELDVAQDSNGRRKSSSRSDAAAKSKATADKLSKKTKGCWQLLDPHEVDRPSTLKSFKMGKVTQLPSRIVKTSDSYKKRKRKAVAASDEVVEGQLLPLIEFCNKEYFSKMDRIPSNPLKALHFTDFEDLYWIQVKKLKEQQRKIYRLRRTEDEDDQDGDAKHPANAVPQLSDGVNGNNDNDDDDDGGDDDGNDDFQIPDAVFSVTAAQAGGKDNDGLFETSGSPVELSGVEIIGSYEELVRRHVECFMASAQQYAQDSALSKRVAEWQERIHPRLIEEEERRIFDIHVYGREMLEKLEELNGENEPALFSKACEGKPAYEVCRYFLASLQLANDRNIEISSRGALNEGLDTMMLKLLSRRQHCDNITDYQAPSLNHHHQQQSQSQSSSQSQQAQKASQSQKSSAPKKRR